MNLINYATLKEHQVSTPMAAQLSFSTTLQDLVKQFLDSNYLRELPIITIMNNHGPYYSITAFGMKKCLLIELLQKNQ